MIIVLRKIWLFIKKYFWAILLGIGLLFFYLFFLESNTTKKLSDFLLFKREQHEKELEVIKQSEKDKEEKILQKQKIYNETIIKLAGKYNEEKKELSDEKTKYVKKLVDKYADSPEELSRALAEEFGIEYLQPQ